ncbi:MAG TPA: VOC family protein [Gemmatimonadales bacterium]|nr:VOC family protein [Gemmatimonadales bacterium]
MSSPPRVLRVLESALYVEDLDRAVAFFRKVMGLEPMVEAPGRLVAMNAGGSTVLLLFKSGSTTAGLESPSGWIPPHDGSGPVHMAFAAEDVPAWEEHLVAHGIAIESHVKWDRGGTSIYFRDPDGHSIEIASRGTWPSW